MDDFSFFLSIAEIAGIFVGFGALISLLGDRQAMGRVTLNIVGAESRKVELTGFGRRGARMT